ncbi:MAG: hypothetical protein K2X73_07205 [Sphingomonas sp.]|uniref:hypothetical protein n=1 Tax=Sphingomonas sp. TaxID=28214 RepID=UPI0025EFF37C|nr:hypothetical protein [Sphingomonas sp.]MBX9881745.1 hypothetical protein [Sphingomonas sp.]
MLTVALFSVASGSVAATPANFAAIVREETARVVVADLPSEPRRFRFKCRTAVFKANPRFYAPPLCVPDAADKVNDPAQLDAVAAAELARPLVTAEDRLRRTAWLRVAVLNDTSDLPTAKARLFTVEESISVADIPARLEPRATVKMSDVTLTAPLRITLSPRTLRHGDGAHFRFACRVGSDVLDCRSVDPLDLSNPQDVDGDLSSRVRGLFFTLRDAQEGLAAARVAPRLTNGESAEGVDVMLGVNLTIGEQ